MGQKVKARLIKKEIANVDDQSLHGYCFFPFWLSEFVENSDVNRDISSQRDMEYVVSLNVSITRRSLWTRLVTSRVLRCISARTPHSSEP